MGNISGWDVVRALKSVGFVIMGQRGSHMKLRKDSCVVIVPLHREVKTGTLHGIAEQAGYTWADFQALLD